MKLKMPRRVLVVDDEEGIRSLLRMTLSGHGYEVELAGSVQEAKDQLGRHLFGGVFCDIGLPDGSGMDLLTYIRSTAPECPVIMITAYASVETAIQAVRRGANDYIQKPFDPEEVLLSLEKVFEACQLRFEHQQFKKEVHTQYDFSKILGTSRLTKQLIERIKDAAEVKSNVLVLGESGTGKEVVAKAIHYNSSRRERPIVTVDCGSIPAQLLESELFGYVKGAFTGADRAKPGLVSEAADSTLFLDEVGELPLELQVKLLRIIQEGEVRPLGGTRSHRVDFRLIAATNRDLRQMIAEGAFREDLFYRLNVIPIAIPPLRQRPEDIQILANHFLEKSAQRNGRPCRGFSEGFRMKMLAHPWPGNVRELENLIEQAVVLCHDEQLSERDWPISESIKSIDGLEALVGNSFDLKGITRQVFETVERRVILRALEKTEHNKSKASELLGISRRALISKVQGYGLE